MAEGGATEMATSLETCADQIPPALQELMTSHDNMLQIAKYCKDAYATEDQATVFGQTKQYTNDALLNVAYHVHKVSLHLTQYLELQSRELEQLDVRVHHLNNRLTLSKDVVARNSFQQPEALKAYTTSDKVTKLEGCDAAAPLPRYEREAINLSLYDDLGTTGGQTMRSTSSLSIPSVTASPPPPAGGPPKPTEAHPPPPKTPRPAGEANPPPPAGHPPPPAGPPPGSTPGGAPPPPPR
eukprot:TRINITY_DN1865_c2_g2_i1.p1 TRINITY_DN1865_c2_g2~~TRINITY_DN1865_c2_g2_i1.p1  ORF type:complete len:258 (+),score=41.39 TRINITY_DN1865_c2_g2_i1:55-774(+)